MFTGYGILPLLALNTINPFTVNIPQAEINYLEDSLRFSRLGNVTYESESEINQSLGVSHTWVKETRDYWLKDFDWYVYLWGIGNRNRNIDGMDQQEKRRGTYELISPIYRFDKGRVGYG